MIHDEMSTQDKKSLKYVHCLSFMSHVAPCNTVLWWSINGCIHEQNDPPPGSLCDSPFFIYIRWVCRVKGHEACPVERHWRHSSAATVPLTALWWLIVHGAMHCQSSVSPASDLSAKGASKGQHVTQWFLQWHFEQVKPHAADLPGTWWQRLHLVQVSQWSLSMSKLIFWECLSSKKWWPLPALFKRPWHQSLLYCWTPGS